MRELKFRIWDKHAKHFCGNLKKYLLNIHTGELEVANYSDLYEEWYYSDHMENDYVIQQYTGLQDKKGKEIYEGDIISYYRCLSDKRLIAPVVFSPFGYGFVLDSSRRHVIGDIKYGDYTLLLHPTTTDMVYEVVGNIFENPELLKQ